MSHRHVPQHPPETWIVVADRARARFFSGTWPLGTALTEVSALIDESGLLRAGEVPNELQGTQIPHGIYRHRSEPQTDYAHQTAQRFARQIADQLDQRRQSGEYGRLILVAPPTVLGILRETLPHTVTKLVVGEVPQDYSRLPAGQIAELLAARLPNPLTATGDSPT